MLTLKRDRKRYTFKSYSSNQNGIKSLQYSTVYTYTYSMYAASDGAWRSPITGQPRERAREEEWVAERAIHERFDQPPAPLWALRESKSQEVGGEAPTATAIR